MTPMRTNLPTDELTAYHRDDRLGRARSPFTTPVFFTDVPPTPTPPPPAPPTPPAPTPPAPTPGPAPTPPPPAPNDPLAVLQAEITRVATAEKAQGARAATSEMLTALGFTTVEEAAAFVKAKREADLAAMTEAERIKAEGESAKTAAEAEKAAAATERVNLRVTERLVLAADLPAERREAVRAQLKLEKDPDVAAIDAAIDLVRKDAALAVLFTPVAPTPPAPTGGPNPFPTNQPGVPTPSSTVPGPAPTPTPPSPQSDIDKIKAGITARTGIK